MSVKLIGIEDVVPNAVKTTGQRGDGIEESVAQPNDENSVFLSERLSGCDFVAMWRSDFLAEIELQGASQDGNYRDACHQRNGYLALHQTARGDGDGQCQGEGPKIKGQIALLQYFLQEFRKEVAHSPSQQQGEQQQREDFQQDRQKGAEKADAGIGIDQGQKNRHDNGHAEIHQYQVRSDGCRAAAQLGCNDGRSRSSGTNHTKHGCLQDHGVSLVGKSHGKQSQQHKCRQLHGQQLEMPRPPSQVFRTQLAAAQKHHGKEQSGLNHLHRATAGISQRIGKLAGIV